MTRDRALVQWIAKTAGDCKGACSVCVGSFLLAEARILSGRRGATHWLHAALLASYYPSVTVEPDWIFVRDVDVGMSAPVVVERLRVLFDLLGPKLGLTCAVIITQELGDQASLFQTEAIGFGLRVKLFSDERTARLWLNANKTSHRKEK